MNDNLTNSSLHVYYQNVNRLRSKTTRVRQAITSNGYDIYGFTETNLNDGVYSHEIFDQRYAVTRRDRCPENSAKKDGGGCLVAVKKSANYAIIHRPDWQQSTYEDIWITLKPLSGRSIHILCVYLPPYLTAKCFENYIDLITDKISTLTGDDILLLGDFNDKNFDTTSADVAGKSQCIANLMDFCGLMQHNHIRNQTSNATLDLILSNSILKVVESSEPVTKVDRYHPPLEFRINLSHTKRKEEILTFRNYKKVDWIELNKALSKIDWGPLIDFSHDTDAMLNIFYDILSSTLDRFCPTVVKKLRGEEKFLSKESIALKNQKRKWHAKHKRHNNPDDYAKYCEIRDAFNKSSENDYARHIEEVEANLQDDPKKFFNFINERRANSAGVAEFVHLDVESSDNPSGTANLFSKQFASAFVSPALPISSQSQQTCATSTWSEVTLTPDDVFAKLCNLNANKSAGPDGFPPVLFKNCASFLTFPLFLLIKSSLDNGCMPIKLKQAHIIPIHKSGSLNDVRNYRPIAKLSIIAKIIDSLMADQLFMHFSHIISTNQHGFFKKRSTVTNLMAYTDKLQQCLEEGGQVDVIYTDFSKAFDKVNHQLLLNKLDSLGVGGSALKWFESYLTGRTQRVKILNSLSDTVEVTSSVVQGSHCGPILFSLFVNDIATDLNVDSSMYADDLKASTQIKSIDDCINLQRNIDIISDFSKKNGLVLNIDKCAIMTFTKRTTNAISFNYKIDNQQLLRKESMRDLGVIYDKKLSFSTHIDKLCKKGRQMCGFIIRNSKHFKNFKTEVTLYKSLARSHLEYASEIWSSAAESHLRNIEKVQHNFIRYLARKYYKDTDYHIDYGHYEGLFKIEPVQQRRLLKDLSCVIKSFNGETDSSSYLHLFNLHVPHRHLRERSTFRPSTTNSITNRLMKSFNKYLNDYDTLSSKYSKWRTKQLIHENS